MSSITEPICDNGTQETQDISESGSSSSSSWVLLAGDNLEDDDVNSDKEHQEKETLTDSSIERVQDVDMTDSESDDICVIDESCDESVIQSTDRSEVLLVEQERPNELQHFQFTMLNFVLCFVFAAEMYYVYVSLFDVTSKISPSENILSQDAIQMCNQPITLDEVINITMQCSKSTKDKSFNIKNCVKMRLGCKVKEIIFEKSVPGSEEANVVASKVKGENKIWYDLNNVMPPDVYSSKKYKEQIKKQEATKQWSKQFNNKKYNFKTCKDKYNSEEGFCNKKSKKGKKFDFENRIDWYTNMHDMRNEIRKHEHKSDWVFDRAYVRKNKRNK